MAEWSKSERLGMVGLLCTTVVCVAITWTRAVQAPRVMVTRAAAALAPASPVQAPATPQGDSSAPAAPPPADRPALAAGGLPSDPSSGPAPGAAQAAALTEVVVHVAGAVRRPGVYRLRAGSRNDDAVKAAGGPAKDANEDAVNLAAPVEDGSQLYLPTREEQPSGGAPDPATGGPAPGTAVSAGPGAARKGGRPPFSSSGSHGHANKLTSPSQGVVDPNRASAAELERIPGVGPAMAQRILQFRQQSGAFRSVDDLMQVRGIGPKKMAKMAPYLRIR